MGSGYIANYFLEDAVHKQNVRSTDLALFLGADPCLENEYQVSILARATYGNIEIVRILLQHGADPDIRDYLGRPAIDSVEDPHIVALLQQAMKDRKKKEHKQ